jgi:hypothetical protein
MAICKLCLQEKHLLKKSHIIPDFMYQDLYDDKHKMISFNPHEYAVGEGHIKNPSSGDYDSYILCKDCDNRIIGGYESYAAKVLFGGLPLNQAPVISTFKKKDGTELTNYKNLDYKNFKLFLLTILWRAGISKRPIFEYIDLGPHASILRKMLYEGDPGTISDYPLFIMTFINDQEMPKDIIITPLKRRMQGGLIVYSFPIAGMIYCFYVNSKQHSLPKDIINDTISTDNQLNIFHIPKGKGWDFLFRYMGMHKKSKKRVFV